MKNFKAIALVTALAISGGFAPGSAFAATSTGTMAVQANVIGSCMVTGGTLSFGDVDTFGAAVTATSNLTTRCTTGTTFTIGMGPGNSVGATTSTRMMSNTTAKLAYGLFTDAAFTVNWDDTTPANMVPGTGTGINVLVPVYGRIPAGQTTAVLIGGYADVVTVTMNF